jgi:formylmethanofuran dehydrogenase subunit E-like metal-binding protein
MINGGKMRIVTLKLVSGILLLCLLIVPAMADTADDFMFKELGERAAFLAMDELEFGYGDTDALVLTNAGRAVVNGEPTNKVLSGIMNVSGLSNGDANLYSVNRGDWKALWFYFFNKDTGMGLYLVPANRYYTMTMGEIMNLPLEDTFSTADLVTGDIYMMLKDTDAGNATQKALGGEAFSLLSLSNAWACGAPYDLMTVASLHNHLCPGVLGGYVPAKYIEEKLPAEESDSYTAVFTSASCKLDAFPVLWDMTPGKQNLAIVSDGFTEDSQSAFMEKYNTSPAGVFVRWNSEENSGDGIVIASLPSSSPAYEGPSWGTKVYGSAEKVKCLDDLDSLYTTIYEFKIDSNGLSELKNPENNPYEVIGMI